MILRTLVEDIFIYQDKHMDDHRRLDLINAINSSMDHMLPPLATTLTNNLSALSTAQAAANTTMASVHQRLCVCALDVFAAYADRMPLQ
jgi:hypothetical protein